MEITEFARNQLITLIASTNSKYIRISIGSGGCAGFNWELVPDIIVNESDAIINDLLIIDDISLKYLNNAKLDYITDQFAQKFDLQIPDTTSKCGCGLSFSF